MDTSAHSLIPVSTEGPGHTLDPRVNSAKRRHTSHELRPGPALDKYGRPINHEARYRRERDEVRKELSMTSYVNNVLRERAKKSEDEHKKKCLEFERKMNGAKEYIKNIDQKLTDSRLEKEVMKNQLEEYQDRNLHLDKEIADLKSSFEHRLAEETHKLKQSFEAQRQSTQESEKYNTIVTKCKHSEDMCRSLEAEINRLIDEMAHQLNNYESQLSRHSVVLKKAIKSRDYFKHQNEVNKRGKIGFRFKYIKIRGIYAKALKSMHTLGTNNVTEALEKIIVYTHRLRNNTVNKHRSEGKALVDRDREALVEMNAGADRLATVRADGRMNCSDCGRDFAEAADLQYHMTKTHFIVEKTPNEIPIITLD